MILFCVWLKDWVHSTVGAAKFSQGLVGLNPTNLIHFSNYGRSALGGMEHLHHSMMRLGRCIAFAPPVILLLTNIGQMR